MIAGVRGIAGHQRVPVSGWQARSTTAGAVAGPDALDESGWIPAASTAADALRAAGIFSLNGPARRFDAEDWWFRARLPEVHGPGERFLVFD